MNPYSILWGCNRRDVSGIEVPISKKTKTNSHGTEAVSSSLDNSCFVAFVTDWSLNTDTLVFTLLLHLPKSHTNRFGMLFLGLDIKCSLIDLSYFPTFHAY